MKYDDIRFQNEEYPDPEIFLNVRPWRKVDLLRSFWNFFGAKNLHNRMARISTAYFGHEKLYHATIY